MNISYYAIQRTDKDGIWVRFPDLKGCFSCGDENDIINMAKESMELYLHGMEVSKLPIPTSSDDINLEDNGKALLITVNIDVKDERLFCSGVRCLKNPV